MSSSSHQAPKHRAPSTRRDPRAALKTVADALVDGRRGHRHRDRQRLALARGRRAPTRRPPSLVRRRRPRPTAPTTRRPPRPRPRPSPPSRTQLPRPASDRAPEVTRSDSRAAADPQKLDTLSLGKSNAMTRTEDLSDEDPRVIAAGAAVRVRLEPGPVRAASTRCGPASPTGTCTPTTPAPRPTASRRPSPAPRWPPPAPTGRPTRSPRSAGASATSRTATARPAAPGADQRGLGWY